MLENITEEEYVELQSKLDELKSQLFNMRFSMAITRDGDQLKKLEENVKTIKREIARTKVKIIEYEMQNKGRNLG